MNPLNNTKRAYKISQPSFCLSVLYISKINLDRKGTSNYSLSNTGQKDKQKWNYFRLKILVIYKFIHIHFTYIQTDIKIAVSIKIQEG